MNKSLSQVSTEMDGLTLLNERMLDEVSDRFSDLESGQQRIAEAGEWIVDAVQRSGWEISDSITSMTSANRKGFEEVGKSILQAGNGVAESNILAAGIVSSALNAINQSLIGIGAILLYRERMDQLRHREKMSLQEEESVAGQARRELKTATSLLFAGDRDQARIHLKKSLEYFPSSAETFRVRSIIESQEEDHDRAVVSLKTALKLIEEGSSYPSIMNISGSETREFKEKVFTSVVTQLSQELCVVGKAEEAISFLSDGVSMYPDNADLQFQRIRVLRNTNKWENTFGKWASELIEQFPEYFNILYSDSQLKKKRKDIMTLMKNIKSEKISQVSSKGRTLEILTEGRFQNMDSYKKSRIEKLNYQDIIRSLNILTAEIKRRNKG